jgi:hypothetical protein
MDFYFIGCIEQCNYFLSLRSFQRNAGKLVVDM